MCFYIEILGSGEILYFQILTIISIISTISIWLLIFKKYNIKLNDYFLPIFLWVFFGILDIIITVKGTFNDPGMEGNPLARAIFENSGNFGPVIASILWISFWSFIVLVFIRKKFPYVFPNWIFYSLFIGHFNGFSSWYEPLCNLPINSLFWNDIIRAILLGLFLALIHLELLQRFKNTRKHHL